MAGGSADAAAVLRALRDLIAPTLTDERLEEIGARVGSDVPFCVRGGTQLAEGRGERLTVLKNAPRLYAAVCKLDFPISTPALFQRSDRVALTDRPDTAAMLAALEAGDAAALCAKVKNVFEQVLPGRTAHAHRGHQARSACPRRGMCRDDRLGQRRVRTVPRGGRLPRGLRRAAEHGTANLLHDFCLKNEKPSILKLLLETDGFFL